MAAIELLLALLIISILFIVMIPLFKSSSTSSLKNHDAKTINNQVQEQVNQIEAIKKQNAEMTDRINQEY